MIVHVNMVKLPLLTKFINLFGLPSNSIVHFTMGYINSKMHEFHVRGWEINFFFYMIDNVNSNLLIFIEKMIILN